MNTIAGGTLECVKHVTIHIGSQPNGSTANLAAADYISDMFRQNGLSVEGQEIPVLNRMAGHTSLELHGELLKASANTFSPLKHFTMKR